MLQDIRENAERLDLDFAGLGEAAANERAKDALLSLMRLYVHSGDDGTLYVRTHATIATPISDENKDYVLEKFLYHAVQPFIVDELRIAGHDALAAKWDLEHRGKLIIDSLLNSMRKS